VPDTTSHSYATTTTTRAASFSSSCNDVIRAGGNWSDVTRPGPASSGDVTRTGSSGSDAAHAGPGSRGGSNSDVTRSGSRDVTRTGPGSRGDVTRTGSDVTRSGSLSISSVSEEETPPSPLYQTSQIIDIDSEV
jgi:hypothetical protein